MLQIKNVNLNVGNTALLSNINLTLEQGKNYGVLGPNGAGKTTLFKSMLGLTDFSGEILSDGQPVSSRCFGSLIESPSEPYVSLSTHTAPSPTDGNIPNFQCANKFLSLLATAPSQCSALLLVFFFL